MKEREGKGSEWPSASKRRQLQTRTQYHGFLPKSPHTRHGVDCPPNGGCWGVECARRAEHANDTATHVELPEKKIWYSESASSRRDSVAVHRRGYGMRWTVKHVPMVLVMVSRLGPGTTVGVFVEP